MSKLLRELRLLFRELKRRKVVRVLAAYAVAAAGVMQAADVAAPRLGLTGNTVNVVILLAIAGLPVAAVLAWLFDVVPDTGSAAAPEALAPDRAPASRVRRRTLPVAATPFIGRETELRELRALLSGKSQRLVTITGPGGVGKTRLAIECAEQVASMFRDGVVYRALSGLTLAEHLVPALAEAIGLQPARREDPLGEVVAFLRGKELLLVLDNLDHLTDAAGVLATLLDAAPDVRMLVTSRERLNLQHETLLTLDGLTLHDAGDAVQLFVASARHVDRHFQPDGATRAQVARICEMLDGIPLAIELASTWVRTLSCGEILVELERDLDLLSSTAPDVEERHHSLRATFDASWRLLPADEQAALARLAVFRSTFDRGEAAQVADADVALLRRLVDKSLLTRQGDRLLMLDVVRTYALERLAGNAAMERRTHERHLVCFASVLHDLEGRLRRADAAAIEQVAGSIDEVRAAWNYATQTSNAAALLRAMDGLFHFYEMRGWAREGADAFAHSSTALHHVGGRHDVPRTVLLAAAHLDVRQGVFQHRLGDLRRAESLLRRGAAAARELDDQPEVVLALHRLGAVRHAMGDYAEAERLHREAWSLAQELDDRLAQGWSLTYLGNVAWSRGEFDEATRLFIDALDLLREEHDLNGMWVTLNNLGVLAASRQQYEEAQRRFREALALQAELKNPRFAAQGVHNLGCAALEQGDFAHARRWLEEALEISERMGYQSMAGLTLVELAELATREGDEPGAFAALQRALRTAGAARNHPLALEGLLTLARLRLRQGNTAAAAELAAVVARHPGGDGDVRRKTAELFEQIGIEAPDHGEIVDIGILIDQIVGTPAEPAAPIKRGEARTRTSMPITPG